MVHLVTSPGRPGTRWAGPGSLAARAGRWLLRESLPFTVATILLATVIWLVFARSAAYDQTMIRTIFWWLSALTVPHMILTAWWHGRGDPNPGDLFTRHV